jgi:hypothetical protein
MHCIDNQCHIFKFLGQYKLCGPFGGGGVELPPMIVKHIYDST